MAAYSGLTAETKGNARTQKTSLQARTWPADFRRGSLNKAPIAAGRQAGRSGGISLRKPS